VSVSIVNAGCIHTQIWEKGDDSAALLARAEKEQTYPNLVKRGAVYKIGMLCDHLAPPPDVSTTPDIVHAITAAFPLTSYTPGNFMGTPTRLCIFLYWLIPDRVTDWFFQEPLISFLKRRIPEWFKELN
jgi:hypothetical protein